MNSYEDRRVDPQKMLAYAGMHSDNFPNQPVLKNEIPDYIAHHSRVIADPRYRKALKDEGYIVMNYEDANMSLVVKSNQSGGLDGKLYFMGKREGPDETRLAFKDVVLGASVDKVMENPHMQATKKVVDTAESMFKNPNSNLEYVGHSLGGYRAKYFGRINGRDQTILGGHETFLTKYPENTEGAKSDYHTIETDPVDLKKLLPMSSDETSSYTTYPRPEMRTNPDGTRDYFIDHISTAYDGPRAEVTPGLRANRYVKSVGGGSTLAGGLAIIGGATPLAVDLVNNDAKGFFKDAGELGGAALFGAPALGAVAVYEYGTAAKGDFERGDTTMGVLHTGDAIAVPVGAAAWGMMGGGALMEGAAAVDNGIATYRDIENKEYDHATAHGIETVAYGAGAVGGIMAVAGALAPETGGLSLLIGGAVAGIAELADTIGKKRYRKRKEKEDEIKQEHAEEFNREKHEMQNKREMWEESVRDKQKSNKKRGIWEDFDRKRAEADAREATIKDSRSKHQKISNGNNGDSDPSVQTSHHPATHRNSAYKMQSHEPGVRG
ncbi:hypothetical protein TVWG_00004 [Tetraselmis viridis virus N1]|uniref:Uncharacterized protein n=1 Tax=Tetraselmis viridis virus S1 TaxID=756285 RepID=M4QMF8_9VIRU|nr:hypothetical protein TVSG_00020 [Tetraselmis viridis virus S1]AET84769.1 hypothetical protein TVWG_00004 [Tetraselmis viridis virus N1]AGH30820.1 hypothetical protein TVSG_00020 [Tetraselmis viridis virus S1]